jgi:hypothetical protein
MPAGVLHQALLMTPAAQALTLEFVASAVSSGSSVTIPASAAAGDLAVYIDYAVNQESIDITPPSSVTPWGFSNFVNRGVTWNAGPLNDFGARGMISRRILTAGDPGSGRTGMTGNNSNSKILMIFRPSLAATAAVASVSSQATNGNPSSQSVLAGSGAAPLVVIGAAAHGGGLGSFSTTSPSFTAQETRNRLRAGYRIYNTSPADHTVDKGDQGDGNFLAAFYAALTAA